MKNVISHIVLALLLAGVAGCRNTDAPESRGSVRAERHDSSSVILSAAQLRSATDRAIKEILCCPQFLSYVESHKKAEGKLPLMAIEGLKNHTNRHLDGETVNNMIADALFKARLVRVASGDESERRHMAAPGLPPRRSERPLVEAPQLRMTSRIALQIDRIDEAKKEVSAVLSVQITELKSGENVMRTSVVWGAEKRRSFLGL